MAPIHSFRRLPTKFRASLGDPELVSPKGLGAPEPALCEAPKARGSFPGGGPGPADVGGQRLLSFTILATGRYFAPSKALGYRPSVSVEWVDRQVAEQLGEMLCPNVAKLAQGKTFAESEGMVIQ